MSTKTARARYSDNGFTIGEQVVVRYDNYPQLRNRELQGQVVTFLGYEWETSVGRWDPHARNIYPRPGIYLDARYAMVRLENGSEVEMWDGYFQLTDAAREAERLAANKKAEPVFLRDLPDTPLWEGDKVCSESDRLLPKRQGATLVVVRIDYEILGYLDCHPYLISSALFNSGWGLQMWSSELTLVERGNVWNYHHGLPLSFENKRDEEKFFQGLYPQGS